MRAHARWLALAALLLSSSPASAFRGRWQLGGGAGAAKLARPRTSIGPLVGAHAVYGVSDLFDVRAAAFAANQGLEGRRFLTEGASLGLAYKLDVLAWVPYAGLSFGYYGRSGAVPAALARGEPGVSVDLGIDYFLARHLGLGFELRYHGFLGDPLSSLRDAPFFTALVRAEYYFGRR